MPEILIEIDEPDLREIEKVAEKERRSRRAQISLILEQWVAKQGEKN